MYISVLIEEATEYTCRLRQGGRCPYWQVKTGTNAVLIHEVNCYLYKRQDLNESFYATQQHASQ
jgi:hypothetical protein